MPPGVVTVTLTGPTGRAGLVATIVLGEVTWNDAALVLPNRTLVAPDRLLPAMVTAVPPDVGPVRGDSWPRAGTGVT